jgi:uncharacterized delta-60 repeat protein
MLAAFVVDTFDDTIDVSPGDGIAADVAGKTSLRAAIMEANALSGDDSISLPAGTFRFAITGINEDLAQTGDLDVRDDLTIKGAGEKLTIIDADQLDRLIEIHGTNTDVKINSLTLRKGVTPISSGYGAVLNGGSLELNCVTVTENHSNFGGGSITTAPGSKLHISDSSIIDNTSAYGGGGIFIWGNAEVLIENSAIANNSADNGAGIFSAGTAGDVPFTSTRLVNVTLSGNQAVYTGGGIRYGNPGSPLTLINCTVTDNTAGSEGGGIYAYSVLSLQNTIVAGNVGTKHDVFAEQPVVSLGNNLIGDGLGQTGIVNGQNGDLAGTSANPLEPLLGPLADNGGPTPTHALLEGSPAIDAGKSADAPAKDQRGTLRPIDGDGNGVAQTDIGAYEFVPAINSPPTLLGNTLEQDVAFAGGAATLLTGAYPRAVRLRDGRIAITNSGASSVTSWKTTVHVFLPNGQPDTSFGASGVAVVDLFGQDIARGLWEQQDGKLLVVGTYNYGYGVDHWATTRLNADGTLDTSFGVNGSVILDVPGFGQADGVSQLPTGDIVVAGALDNSRSLGILRLKANGVVDTSFDGDGLKIIDLGNTADNSVAFARVIPAENGSFWVKTGREYSAPAPQQSILLKIESTGIISVDSRQNLGAAVYSDDVTIDGQQRMIVAGYVDGELFLIRYLPTGSLDSSFGAQGIVRLSLNLPWRAGASVAIDSSGKLLVGYVTSDWTTVELRRFEPDGTADQQFGTNGVFTVRFGQRIENGFLDLVALSAGEFLLAVPSTQWQYQAVKLVEKLSDVSIPEDSLPLTIPLTGITAGGGESQPLRVTAVSSDVTIVAHPIVTYRSPDTSGSLELSPLPDKSGSTVITVTVEDGGLDGDLNTVADNKSLRRSFTVNVNEVNDAPVLTAIGNKSVAELTELTFTATATDAELPAETLTFSLIGAPSGASINPTTGVFSWTPTETQGPASHTFTVRVTDNGTPNLSDEEQITVVVNTPPTLDFITNITIDEDAGQQTVTLKGITAGGGANQPIEVSGGSHDKSLIPDPIVTYASPNSTGTLKFTPVADQSGTTLITVFVMDGGPDGDLRTNADNGNFARTFRVTINPLNDAPVLAAIGNKTVAILKELTFTATATDSDLPADTLTFSLVGAPSGASINSTTGVFSWTPTETQGPGSYTFTVRATDNGSPHLSDEEQITVVVHTAPTLNAIANMTIDEDAGQQTITLTGISAGGGESQPIEVSAGSHDKSLIPDPIVTYASPNSTGTLKFTPVADQSGTTLITVFVMDGGPDGDLRTTADNGNFARTFRVTINPLNDAPVLAAIGNKTVNELATLTFTASATDVDLPANTLTYSLVGAPSGAAIDPTTGVFSWTPTEAQGPDSYTFTVKVTDNGTPALSDEEQITVTVNEPPAPTTRVWDGGSSLSSNWTDGANWQGNVAPVAGDYLIFPADAAQFSCTNDFPAGTAFGTILISGDGYTLEGNLVKLSGGLSSAGTNALNVPLQLTGGQGIAQTSATGTLTVGAAIDFNGYALTLDTGSGAMEVSGTGTLKGSGSLTKIGSGTLTLATANTYSGTTAVEEGTIAVKHGAALGWGDGTAATATRLDHDSMLWLQNSISVNNHQLNLVAGLFTSSDHNTWTGSIFVDGPSHIRPFSGSTLEISGVITTSSAITHFSGGGRVILSGNSDANLSSFDVIDSTILEVDGSLGTSGLIAVARSATLSGSGTVISSFADPNTHISIGENGHISPGNDATPGILNLGNSLRFFGNGNSVKVRLNGASAGQYDQVKVQGDVSLNGATLNVALGIVPTSGQSFTILDNDGTDSIVGTFAGLGEGDRLMIGSIPFRISYKGGTGNDAVLTAVTFDANERVWDGCSSVSSNWTDAANWQGNVAPVAGDYLIFPADAAQLNSTNDFPAGTAFGSILISGAGYTLTGNLVQLNRGVKSAGTNAVNVPLQLTREQAIEQIEMNSALTIGAAIDLNGYPLTLNTGSGAMEITGNGTLKGDGSLTKIGGGTLTLATANTFSGTTAVEEGTLAVKHSDALGWGDGTAATATVLDHDSMLWLQNSIAVKNHKLDLVAGLFTSSDHNLWAGSIFVAGPSHIRPFAGSTLEISGAITTNAISHISGGGRVILSGTSDANLGMFNVIDSTVLEVNGSLSTSSTVQAYRSATLSGTGTVISTSTAPTPRIVIGEDGHLAPGTASTTGTLTLGNSLAFSGSSHFLEIRLNGANAGQFDQIRVLGAVSLGGATLNVKPGFIPTIGQAFTILDNDDTDPIEGTFAGLDEGDLLVISDATFQISYIGGTGSNDVILTTVEGNHVPTVATISNLTMDEDAGTHTITLTGITAGGSESQPLRVTAVSSDVTIVPHPAVTYISPDTSGSLKLSPLPDKSGSAVITVTVEDGGFDGDLNTVVDNASVSRSFTVTVNEVNDAPVLAAIGNKTVNELATLAFTASTTDADLPANTLTYSLVGAPSGATINSTTGVFSWTPTEAQGPGSYTLTVKVTDNGSPALSDEEQITVTVNEVNDAPALAAIGNKTVNELATLTFTASATDADLPANTLTYSLVGAPSGATINSTTGVFSWTPTEAQGPGSYTLTVKVTDNGSPAMTDEEQITVTVNEVNDAPVLAAIGNKTVNELATLTFTASATDSDLPANTLTYSLVGAPSGATINSTTGVFSWTPTEAQGPDSYTFTVKVTDNGTPALSDEEQITVTVNEVNDAPVLAAIGNKTVNELATLTFTASATDSDLPANTLTYSLVGAPSGATIDSTTGVFSWTPTEAQGPGSHTLTVKVTDNGSPALSDEEQITVTVNERNEEPALDAIADMTITEDAGMQTITLTGITAGGSENQPIRVAASSNNIGLVANPTVTYTSPNNAGILAFQSVADQNGIAVVTVTVEDCGLDGNLNTAADNAIFSRQFKVTVTAVNDPPVRLAGTPSPLTIEENSSPTAIPLGLNSAVYSPGDGADEASQVMTCTLTAIPSYMQLFKANGTTSVPVNSALTCSEMAGLKYKTVAGARGTDTIAWRAADNGSPSQSLTESLAVTAVAFNNPPVRLAGSIKPISVKEDKANTKAVSLKLSKLKYGPGGATSEVGQTLTYRVTSIPAGIQVFKKDGTTQVFAGNLVTLTDLKGLKYKTFPNATGTGVLTWTVTDNGPISKTLTESLTLTITAVNDAPVRTAGTLTPVNVLKDSANTTAVSLKLNNLTYGPGGGADESGQSLKYVVTAIPAHIQLFRSSGAAVSVNATLTIADLQGLAIKTVAGRTGKGNLTWTVTDNGSPAMVLTEKIPITVGSALRVATTSSPSNSADILTPAELQPLVNAAISRWAATGLDPTKVALLAQIPVTIADLSSQDYLGFAARDQIVIDDNGAGLGWFIDVTPNVDEEFVCGSSGPAASRMDLLTVVMHEMGHVIGLSDLDTQSHSDQLMAGMLDVGQRRSPVASTSPECQIVDYSFLLAKSRTTVALARNHRNVLHEFNTDRVFADLDTD